MNFRNTEKFESLLSLLVVEENVTQEESKEDDKKCTKYAQEKEKTKSNERKELRETEAAVKTKLETESSEDRSSQAGPTKSGDLETGIKKEKDVMVIVEELRTLRDHQADLINQLMAELSYTEKENNTLRNQVCRLLDSTVYSIFFSILHDGEVEDGN